MTAQQAHQKIEVLVTRLSSINNSLETKNKIGSKFSNLINNLNTTIGENYMDNSEALVNLCVILNAVCNQDIQDEIVVKRLVAYLNYIPLLMKIPIKNESRTVVATFGGAVSAINMNMPSNPQHQDYIERVLPIVSLHYYFLHNSIRIPFHKDLIAAYATSIFAVPQITTIMQKAKELLQNMPSREFDIRFTLIKIYDMDKGFSNETQLKMYELVMNGVFHGTMLYDARK